MSRIQVEKYFFTVVVNLSDLLINVLTAILHQQNTSSQHGNGAGDVAWQVSVFGFCIVIADIIALGLRHQLVHV